MNLLKKNNVFYFFSVPVLIVLLMSISCREQSKKTEVENYAHTNALINETSPYLLQHAHNPVDWRPWSQEALQEAKEKNKLVLVSIGYSSCHWCHVMEEETFENDSIAKLMNENFINIKVDREERPDVDQVYMTAVQLMKGNGGWPLNVITLPNGKPLYGGTYHTKNQWQKVLTEISRLYKENPEKAEEYSDMVALGIQEANLIAPSKDFEQLNEDVLTQSVENWKSTWDTEWGGDQRDEKFMLPVNLNFLLDYALLTNDKEVLKHVELTLDKISLGGIYDHVGGGFFRYSTDSQWKVPHFEKMLYDNAQALSLYSKAFKVFKKDAYKNIVLGTIAFLEREMKAKEGGYFAALDADSEGEEGKFYVWTKEELQQVLGSDFDLFSAYYNVEENKVWGNNSYVLHKSISDRAFILASSMSLADLKSYKNKWQQKLLVARSMRTRPRTDDKIITSWNSLLIKGYVDAYMAFGNPEFLGSAEELMQHIQANSYQAGKLGHSYKEGSKHIDAFLEDYTFLAHAALRLYEASLNTEYLMFGQKLMETVERNFADEASGMYTYNQDNILISKVIKTDDGVIPSPNSVMANNLFKLGHIYYEPEKITKSKEMISSIVPLFKEDAYAYANWGTLLSHIAYPYYEVAIVGKDTGIFLKEMGAKNIPNILLVGSTDSSEIALFKDRFFENDTFIYVCQDNACKLPVKTVKGALELLRPDGVEGLSPFGANNFK
ncbi:thioredoxin domain-containing protein [Maribacter aestuarii]|uniref:thioredoxin domain-containing protein n=1 Tax=Maribacter aestuarii TaxID=1130723 RepID=UPI0025A5D875|nr:thioredoxin domain-containing protein [Maribacter aestuarii]